MSLSSTILVNVSEDAELRLVSLLADAAPSDLLGQDFRDQCSSRISAGDAAGLLQTIVQDSGAVAALTILPNDQAMAAVSILAALLQRLEPTTNTKLAKSLADTVTAASNATADQKIHILSILYNMRPSVTEKCALLAQMIRLAAQGAPNLLADDATLGRLLVVANDDDTSNNNSNSSSKTAFTQQTQPVLVNWLDSWKVPPADRRELYKTIADLVQSRRQRFLLLLCETYRADSNSNSPEALDAAKKAAIGAIQDPVTHFAAQRDILQLAAGLQQTDPFLYDLSRVFQQGTIADYTKLMAGASGTTTTPQLLLEQQYGLNDTDCAKYMRILSLCLLAAQHEEIPYSAIAETLQLKSVRQVETWVIAAVNSGLLQAKMDQLKECVMVERCVVRQFGDMEQWKILQRRLRSWKQNVGGILQTLKETKAAATN